MQPIQGMFDNAQDSETNGQDRQSEDHGSNEAEQLKGEKPGSPVRKITGLPRFIFSDSDLYRLCLLADSILCNKVNNHNRTKRYPIPAEHFEVVLFDVTHQKFNRENRNGKGDQHPGDENNQL